MENFLHPATYFAIPTVTLKTNIRSTTGFNICSISLKSATGGLSLLGGF